MIKIENKIIALILIIISLITGISLLFPFRSILIYNAYYRNVELSLIYIFIIALVMNIICLLMIEIVSYQTKLKIISKVINILGIILTLLLLPAFIGCGF
jgi:hypothetical protein